jgi:hypothetical protein
MEESVFAASVGIAFAGDEAGEVAAHIRTCCIIRAEPGHADAAIIQQILAAEVRVYAAISVSLGFAALNRETRMKFRLK